MTDYRILDPETLDPAYEAMENDVRVASPQIIAYFATLHPLGAMAMLGDLMHETMERFDSPARRDLLKNWVNSFLYPEERVK